MKLRVRQVDCYRIDMHTRFPFRYGIASMTELPHLVVLADLEVDGEPCRGVAADGLPPKWFTKNADTRFEDDDLPGMLRVIRHAADAAISLGTQPSPFACWWELYRCQHAWATEQQIAPLLAGFGTSLIERAILDAVCRQQRLTLFDGLRSNAFEMDLGSVRPSLRSCGPAAVLPERPLSSVQLRHTVGLGDPLTAAEAGDEVDDGLPYSLVANIREYGLKYFKIKLSGNVDTDQQRMTELANILQSEVGDAMRFTLDGNEQYDDVASFRDCWNGLRAIPAVKAMIDQSLLFVEQPLHRDQALDPSVQAGLQDWSEAPPIIIDESDAELSSLPAALELGYAGTSHKNCKGIFKSVLAAATIAIESEPDSPLIQSAEDLANVGPIALLQDLAVVASLGIPHVERNGHHYFRGLSMYPEQLQRDVVADHGDLYRWHGEGFAALAPVAGRLDLSSVNQAPFGVTSIPDLAHYEPWDF